MQSKLELMPADDTHHLVKIEEKKTANPPPVAGNFAIAQQPIKFQATPALLHVR
jgi:hypothetical protein